MVHNFIRLTFILSFLILFSLFGCTILPNTIQELSAANLPIRGLQGTIDINRREELYTQLRNFANKHDFEFSIRRVYLTPDGISFHFIRTDLEIRGTDIPDDPKEIKIRIYKRRDFTKSVPKESVDELFTDLWSFISVIPDIAIVDLP